MKLSADLVVVLVLLVVGVLPGGRGQGEVLQPDVVLVVLGVGLPVLALVPFITTLLLVLQTKAIRRFGLVSIVSYCPSLMIIETVGLTPV